MKKQPKIKRYWAEIPTRNNGTKILWFDSMDEGKEHLKKIGFEQYAIFDVMEELPF